MAATTAEIAAVPEARRGPWLLKGFYHSGQAFGAILIIYLIQDYKASPSKSRALYITTNASFKVWMSNRSRVRRARWICIV